MITGLTMQASSYDPMAQHLASNPKNGPVAVYVVADGKFHQGSVTGPVMTPQQAHDAKLFEVQYIDVKGSPTEKAPQIAKAMQAIQGATGQNNVDVVCHSAGCTDFRLYLQSRQDQSMGIDHAVFIGPASHGTEMGNVGDAVGAPLGLKQAGAELAVGSSLVDDLNKSWSNQLGQVKGGVTIVGLKGAPTASPEGLVDGDGYMPADSVGMPGAKTVMLQGVNPTPLMHLWEVHYSGVINTVDQALAG
ncbi:MAG: alpha/beta hydrolase [Deltaproteobacteria bacterium]|nr:alpha/beta hydrolase [Deltaproteobacteria bacterium]